MANLIKTRGMFWWLEGTAVLGQGPQNAGVPGLLTISKVGEIKLELDGELSYPIHPYELPPEQAGQLPQGRRIVGRLTSGQNNVAILDSLLLTSYPWLGISDPSQSYVADFCLLGSGTGAISEESLTFTHFRVELKGLEEWLNLNVISGELTATDPVSVTSAVSYKNLRFEYNNDDGNLLIETQTSDPFSLPFLSLKSSRKVVYKQTDWLEFAPRFESSIGSMCQEFTRLEEFFAVLLGGYLRLSWPYLIREHGEEQEWYRLYYLRGPVPDFEPTNWNLLTQFSWMHLNLGDLYYGSKARREIYGPGYYLYLASMRNDKLYAEHKFVNLIWAIESLHRKKRTESPLPNRQVQRILGRFSDPIDKADLKWLKGKLKYAQDPTLEERIVDTFSALPLNLEMKALRRFSKRCAERRNQISHTGGPTIGETYKEFSEDLARLTNALSYLHHALLLHEIGLDAEHLKLAMTKTILAQRQIVPALRDVGLIVGAD